MSQPETAVVEVALRNCFCATELESLQRSLGGLTGVLGVHVDRTRAVAHLRYAPQDTTAETLRGRVAALGYPCECAEEPDSCCQPGHPCVGGHDARATQHRPATDPSGHDHAGSQTNADLGIREGHLEHAGPDEHGAVGHDAHAGHGSNMVADMLRRLVVSAVLTVPIVLFSPIGESVGFDVEPPLGLSMAWFGFILATPVVFWGGWPFLSAAWRAARRGEANMMTLIATAFSCPMCTRW
jgi:Cu2+-exporting ATPase